MKRAVSRLASRRLPSSAAAAGGQGPGLPHQEKQAHWSEQRATRPVIEPRGQGEYCERTNAAIERMLRVDHAGEYGAVRIYEGQLAVLGSTKVGPLLREMKEQEDRHLSDLERLMPRRRVRPTVFLPFWDVAGFALGAGTSLLGEKAAMACTVAVEEAIVEHYDDQLREIARDHPSETVVADMIRANRDDEDEHRETGIAHNAYEAPFYDTLTAVIKAGCKGAIWLSSRF